ncbi:hypothetical protein EBT23_04515 [bacterium]|nr:hypothetical protein [bacterium]
MGLLIPILLLLVSADFCFAPPLQPRQTTPASGAPSDSSSGSSFDSASTTKPVVSPDATEDEEIRQPVPEKVLRATLPAAHTPARHGDTSGPYWIGQRTMVEDYCGWGWLRTEKAGWSQARWVVIQYDPEICPVPHAFLPRPQDDMDYQYKLYGEFAPYRAYEPQADVWVDVFLIKGFVSLGPAKNPILREPPAHGSSKPNRFAERGANLR